MKPNLFLANRIRELFLNGTWIANTNFREQIQSVDWQQATRKVGNLNTIASLTFHINYYVSGLLKAFETGNLSISDKYSFDMPGIRSEADWNALVSQFLNDAERLAKAVEQMPEEQFDQPFFDEKYGSYWRNLEAMIEHGYYHLGQISLIRKMGKDLD